MSESTQKLERKIRTAQDLHAVVRTLKAVAAASIGQYEKALEALDDYYRSVKLGLGACLRSSGLVHAGQKEGDKILSIKAVVFGTDQGLVSQFNDAISEYVKTTYETIQTTVEIWAVGERVRDRLLESGFTVSLLFEVPNTVNGIVLLLENIMTQGGDRHQLSDREELVLFYNKTENGMYRSTFERLLPFDFGPYQGMLGESWPGGRMAQIVDTERATLGGVLDELLFISLFRACAESLASENASRLMAMQRADHTIKDLLQSFSKTFHQLRKDDIDEELFDLISSFDVLKKTARKPESNFRLPWK